MPVRPASRRFAVPSLLMGAVFFLTGVLFAAAAPAAEHIPAAKRIPRESLLYVSVPDARVLIERVSASYLGRMARDDAFQPFLATLKAFFENKLKQEIEKNVGLTPEDLLKLPSGEITFALLPMDEDKLPIVIFFQFGEHREQIETLLAKAVEREKERGATLSTDEVEGTEVTTLKAAPRKADDEDSDDKDSDDEDGSKKNPFDDDLTSWFIKDDMLVFGAGTAWPKTVLARWDGEGSRSLADNRSFQAIMDACRDEDRQPCVEYFVDFIGLMKSILQSGEAVSPQVAIFLGFLPQLGLDKLHGIGGVFDLGWDGTEQRMRTLVQIDQPPTRLMKLFQFPPRDLEPSDWIPSSAGTYGALSWDLAAAWEAIGETVDTFQGKGKFEELIARASKELEVGDFNLKTDLVDQFTGSIEWFLPVTAEVPQATLEANESDDKPDAARVRFGVGLQLANSDTFRKTLANLSKSPIMASVNQKEFEGQTIYEIPGGTPLYFAVVADRLLITPDRELIENAFRDNKGEGLRDSADFQRYFEKLVGPLSLLGFEREGDNTAGLVEMLKQIRVDDDTQIDFSTLPDAETIKKYLTPSITTMKPHEQGLLIEQFSLPPAEKE